ncbi:MAG: hypothetical protein J7L72_11720 [Candidatus Aminicenantes bacterium]|nr:hypothetical protein [Candidatus Aminicenantes bacterium]
MNKNKTIEINGKKYFTKPFEGCFQVEIEGKYYYTDQGFFDLSDKEEERLDEIHKKVDKEVKKKN